MLAQFGCYRENEHDISLSSEVQKGARDMAFRKSWINFLHKAATGTKKTRTLLTPIGLIIFGLFTAWFVFAAIILDRLLHLPRLLPEGARLPLDQCVGTEAD